MNRYGIVSLALLLLLVGLNGCQRQQAVDGETGGKVQASEAYRHWFGQPPAVAEGTAWALVGFFTLAAEPEKVMPVPLFLFTAHNQPQLLLGKILQGGAYLHLPQLAENPFPAGTSVRGVTVVDGLAVADFSGELSQLTDPALQQGALAAIGHTLLQLAAIERVRVTSEGEPLFFAPDELSMAADDIVDPGPPALLQALRHEDADAVPGEVVVFFNRPVRLKSFRLEYPVGQQVAGQYFTSVFDMAIILHPDDAERMLVGSEVLIAWQVADMLGRENAGQATLPLGLLSHE